MGKGDMGKGDMGKGDMGKGDMGKGGMQKGDIIERGEKTNRYVRNGTQKTPSFTRAQGKMKAIPEHHTFSMRLRVTPEMTARFFDCEIHPLYATFAIVEHAEYACRCAILPFLEPEEDAIGSSVEIEHTGPAHVGAIVTIETEITGVEGKDIISTFTAKQGEKEIARGKTTQRVVDKAKFQQRIQDKA